MRRYQKVAVAVSSFLFLLFYSAVNINEAVGSVVYQSVRLGMGVDSTGVEHGGGDAAGHKTVEGTDPDMEGMKHGGGDAAGHESVEGMDPDMEGMEHGAGDTTGHDEAEKLDTVSPGAGHGEGHGDGLEAEVKRPRVAVLSSFGFVSFMVLVVAFVMKRKNEMLVKSKKLERNYLRMERVNEK